MKRRTFLGLSALGITGAAGSFFWPDEGLFNPCLSGMPSALTKHRLFQKIWQGIDTQQLWDCHTHLVGTGDSHTGIWVDPDMMSVLHPAKYLRYKFYLDGACANKNNVDHSYIEKLLQLNNEFPAGFKMMLLAFDHHYTAEGKLDKSRSPFYVSNDYAAGLHHDHPQQFEWIASIHPYRDDAIEELDRAVKNGARAVKWLPPVMGIDASLEKCDRFYAALRKHSIPILTHTGDENAVAGVAFHHLSNPLLFRRPLEQGVKIIMAHSACEGSSIDIDKGKQAGEVANFDLFKRLLNEKQYEKNLYGEISAITQVNHMGRPLDELIVNEQWHHRLINGSDYPLPGVMPIYSLTKYVKQGYLNTDEATFLHELRQYNPFMFDFALKRLIKVQNKKFTPIVFHSRRVFV